MASNRKREICKHSIAGGCKDVTCFGCFHFEPAEEGQTPVTAEMLFIAEAVKNWQTGQNV